MKTMQKGFTLIELMIVVAIIGILAMFALPAYQDYTKRTHVAEGLQLAASAKSAVTEYFASNGEWPADNQAAGISTSPSDIKGNAVESIEIKGKTNPVTAGDIGAEIEITYNQKVDATNSTILLQAKDKNGSVLWNCKEGTVLPKYRPANCRVDANGW